MTYQRVEFYPIKARKIKSERACGAYNKYNKPKLSVAAYQCLYKYHYEKIKKRILKIIECYHETLKQYHNTIFSCIF